jgi:hypothetical protein
VVRGDVGEGAVRGEEEGVVLGGGGVEELDDVGVVVDEGGEAGGVRAGFEDLVDGFARVVVVVTVVAVAGVLVVAVVAVVAIVMVVVSIVVFVITVIIMMLVVIVVGVEDGKFLLLLSGCYGTHESIPVQQSVPRVHGRGYIMLVGLPGRPKDNLIDFPRGSFRSHQGGSEARREDQESLHLVDGTGLAGGRLCRKTNIQERDKTTSLGGDRTQTQIFREHDEPIRRFYLQHAI